MTEEQRERNRARDRKYRNANREETLERHRAYYQRNKEKRREYNSRYYAEHREQLSERRKARRRANPERAREQARRSYYRTRPKRLERMREYRLETRKTCVEERHCILRDVKSKVGCLVCGESDPVVLSFHHRNPKEKIGCVSNLMLGKWSEVEKELKKCDVLCANCHMRLHHEDKNKCR